jgi:hypothetical protein
MSSQPPATAPTTRRVLAVTTVSIFLLLAGCTSTSESEPVSTATATSTPSTSQSTATATSDVTVEPTATASPADEGSAVPVATRDFLASEACRFWDITDDGRHDTATVDGDLVRRELHSGEVTAVAPAPEPCMVWHGDEDLDRMLVIDPTSDPQRFRSGTFDGTLDSEWTLDDPAAPLSRGLVASGRILMAGLDRPTAFLMDDATGAIIGDTIRATEVFSAAANADGSLFAVSVAGAAPEVVVLDGQSGEVVATVTGNTPATALVFDEQSGDLLAGLRNGFVATIDVAAGEIVAEVDPGTTDQVFDLAVEDDGTVVALTINEVVRLDRSDGQIGEPVMLRDGVRGRLLDDGSGWWLQTSDDTLEIYDAPS